MAAKTEWGIQEKNMEFLQLSNNFVNSEEPVLSQRRIKCEFTREVLEKYSLHHCLLIDSILKGLGVKTN